MNSLLNLEMIELFARGGGGGSSGGGGGAGGVIGIVIFIVAVIVGWWKRKQRIKKAKKLQAVAQQTDPTWNDAHIKQRVESIFYAFQNDWQTFNSENIKAYTTPHYGAHLQLMLYTLHQMGRQNFMQNVQLAGLAMLEVLDSDDDSQDAFDIEVTASAFDQLYDLRTSQVIYTDNKPFCEVWHFERSGRDWVLGGISQPGGLAQIPSLATETAKRVNGVTQAKALQFAVANNFYYNADFGWLLMPRGGQLFGDANFDGSDINHHVLGVYKNVVIQFFEYIPYQSQRKRTLRQSLTDFRKRRNEGVRYIVAAATLPRDYGNIVVTRKRFFFGLKPRGLEKVETESHEFNKKYSVYASSADRVSSFELLHPAYIEKLEQLPFRVSIEVIGRNLYLHTTDIKKADYNQMLSLLREAFKELQM